MNRDFTTGLFVLLGALWGTSFVAIEIGLSYFPPVLFAGIRYYIAGALILVYAVLTADRWRLSTRGDWATALGGGVLMIGGHHAFLYLGQQYVTGAVAAVVVSLGPVLTAVFASLVLPKERLTVLGCVGLAFGLAGVWVIADPDTSTLLSTNVVGIGLVFVAVAVFGLGSVWTRVYRTDLPVAALQGWAMLVGATLLHVTSALRGESFAAIQWTPTALGSLAYLAVISGSVAFLIYFELLDRLGPAEINLIGYLEPVFATIMSFLFFGRLVDASTATGFLAIFVGFAVIKRRTLARVVDSVGG